MRVPYPQFSGFYIAQEKGHYAQENIELTFAPGGLDVGIMDNVVSGEAQFGIWLGNGLLEARARGQPVKAIAAILQINPLYYFSLAETGIEKPADLAGRRVAAVSMITCYRPCCKPPSLPSMTLNTIQ